MHGYKKPGHTHHPGSRSFYCAGALFTNCATPLTIVNFPRSTTTLKERRADRYILRASLSSATSSRRAEPSEVTSVMTVIATGAIFARFMRDTAGFLIELTRT